MADPETHTFTGSNGERTATHFRIAHNGEPTGKKPAMFLDVVAYDGLGSAVVQQLARKGIRIIVSGRLTSRACVASDGGKRTPWTIVAGSVVVVKAKSKLDGDLSSSPS